MAKGMQGRKRQGVTIRRGEGSIREEEGEKGREEDER